MDVSQGLLQIKNGWDKNGQPFHLVTTAELDVNRVFSWATPYYA